MFAWFSAHQTELLAWNSWAIEHNLYRKFSALMYVLFAIEVFVLAAQRHAAIAKKYAIAQHDPVAAQKLDEGPSQFHDGFFFFLVAHLLPLTITGFILRDEFIIGTRVGMLLIVLLTYAMVTTTDGTFRGPRYRIWASVWLAIAILGPMFWVESTTLRTFVHDYEQFIAWSAVGAMFAFVIRGQWELAKTLFKHFVGGNSSSKRLMTQVTRFFVFAPQAIHYWFVPSGADSLIRIDPVFMQSLMGVGGIVIILVFAAIGFIRGTAAREIKKHHHTTSAQAA